MAGLNHCRRHQIEFNLFCQDCEMEICLMCCMEDHRSHKVTNGESGKKADLEIFKDSALNCMAKLKENKDRLEENTTELARNQKDVTGTITFHFKEVRQKIKNDETKLKEAITKHTEMQRSRIAREIEQIEQKQKQLEDLISIYDSCLQERQDVEGKSSSEIPCLSPEIKTKMQCAEFALAKPIFLPENNFIQTSSHNTFGRIFLELQGTLSDDELDFDEKLKEKLTNDMKPSGAKNKLKKEEYENDKRKISQSCVKEEDTSREIKPPLKTSAQKSTPKLTSADATTSPTPKESSSKSTTGTEIPRGKRYTRERAPPLRRDEAVRNSSPVKLLHSWKTEKLKSVAVSDDGLFTLASGQCIKQFDIAGSHVNTLARNVDVLPSFMAYSLFSNKRHLIQYYGDSKMVEIICLEEENEKTVKRLQLDGICVCVSTVEIQDDKLYYQKTTKGKRGSTSANISVIDVTQGKLTEINNINLDMSMVRNFHCIKNVQKQLQLVVANKDL